MELYSSAWHLVSALLVFLTGMAVVVAIGRHFLASTSRSVVIYSWHTLLCFVYLWYILTYGGDAIGYFRKALAGGIEFDLGTRAIEYIAYLLVQGLDLSLLGVFLVFNIFGTIGLLAFDGCLRTATVNKAINIRRLATLIVFLPSISFWSSAIGKDALSFMATGLALWAALNLSRRAPLMAFAVAVMLLVRPHMAGFMVIGLIVAFMMDSKASISMRVVLSGIAVAIAITLVPLALQTAKFGGELNADTLMNYVEIRQSYNMQGGGGVDIANMSLPMQLFTYLFRPIIFEARTIFALAASIDNLILLYLFIAGGRIMLGRGKSLCQENRAFMWSYSLIAWVIMALTTANLGIALRQKWMFAPMVIFLFISVIGRDKRSVVSRQQPSDGAVVQQQVYANHYDLSQRDK